MLDLLRGGNDWETGEVGTSAVKKEIDGVIVDKKDH